MNSLTWIIMRIIKVKIDLALQMTNIEIKVYKKISMEIEVYLIYIILWIY
jgi:hypothetical protein